MTKNKKENYFINDEGKCICVMNGTEDDSVYDALEVNGYKLKYGVIADDFNKDYIHKDCLKEK
tara:strand:+ start:292 stop:480 length:189 start_codon:yes stop_codon:yes gene_type:complete